MRLKVVWDLQRSLVIGFNVYLIFSLNFVGIFCHGRPPSISYQVRVLFCVKIFLFFARIFPFMASGRKNSISIVF